MDEKVILFFLAVVAPLLMLWVGSYATLEQVRDNTLDSYHCAPIQKASTITEAKRIVSGYQEGVK